MKGGLKNPQEASRVLSHQIIGFNRNNFLRNYKSVYRQQPRAPVRRPKRQASVKDIKDEEAKQRLDELTVETVEPLKPVNIKIEQSQESLDGKSTVAPTNIGTAADGDDMMNLSVVATKDQYKPPTTEGQD